MEAQKVLVVDDEAIVREMLEKILKDKGYSVLMANNGSSAIEMAKNNEVDIALVDIRLPDINGVQVLEGIKNIKPDILVIMMTAYETEELVRKAFGQGAQACLHKPFNVETLFKIFKELEV